MAFNLLGLLIEQSYSLVGISTHPEPHCVCVCVCTYVNMFGVCVRARVCVYVNMFGVCVCV